MQSSQIYPRGGLYCKAESPTAAMHVRQRIERTFGLSEAAPYIGCKTTYA